jgi:hypothetical protein
MCPTIQDIDQDAKQYHPKKETKNVKNEKIFQYIDTKSPLIGKSQKQAWIVCPLHLNGFIAPLYIITK